MGYIAPAGTRISLLEVLVGLGVGIAPTNAFDRLQDELATRARKPLCRLVASGRAAMTTILQAMYEISPDRGRNEVIVPGYTCYSVPAAIARAGLKPRLCDIDPATLSYDPAALARFDFSRVLAIVSANLYGIPNALHDIEALAARNGVFMLDDAAQSLGARLNGRAVGGFGDAGLYSFDKGKNITTIQGGAIVAGPPLAAAMERHWQALDAASTVETLSLSAKMLVYATLLRPSLYGVVHRLPFLGLGRTAYEPRYPIARYSRALASLAERQYRRLDAINAVRTANAGRLRDALSATRGVRMAQLLPGAEPVYARFPMFVTESARRASVVEALDRAGIGATTSYPNALADVPEVAAMVPAQDLNTPGAREVANTIVTLPTHGYCPPDLAARAARVVSEQLGR
ncbi:DegT/DnrJ/EryC1/StrS family aminotransferase [Steroidobacter sp. S1-65]|uniref:DegT/DnrJ/EryC1/StrS family aminotransferase n=1 Tax=Steroidobacter gossypii TaxID=2805490 RepID=A0ABS1WZ38_9GAMM|nr:DegT/DnrJ/EryC1/StrS family aminotransferase [Steroidobacter gossypii]MBM0106217.1 DegT/DnrJ/EryC1/StrS family aminotransferase [Steroidobacter gossypii]